MIVVADTTPLISLMKIGHLGLLEQVFGDIQIPEAVFDELVENPRFAEESRQIRECTYIKVTSIEDLRTVDDLRISDGLDKGESEAIVLSEMLNADFLLMDEAKGRQVARQRGIHIMGTIGIILAGYNAQYLSQKEILKSIEILKKNGRHISDKLYQQLLEKISE
jgi:predicted nucleic acid-binding protein